MGKEGTAPGRAVTASEKGDKGGRLVVVQYWVEYEHGWGSRPDGVSIHRADRDRVSYIQAYWDRMPDEVPPDYSAPTGGISARLVDDEIYEGLSHALKNGEYGLRFSDTRGLFLEE